MPEKVFSFLGIVVEFYIFWHDILFASFTSKHCHYISFAQDEGFTESPPPFSSLVGTKHGFFQIWLWQFLVSQKEILPLSLSILFLLSKQYQH